MWRCLIGGRLVGRIKFRVPFTAPSRKHTHRARRQLISNYHSHCINSEVVPKLVKSSLGKMRSAVFWLLLLSAFVAAVSIAANGENTSTVSKKIPAKLDDRTIICNVVQSSHSQEAIKSLEATLVATLEKKFEQLTAALNKTAFHGMLLNSNSCFFMTFSLFSCCFT